MEDKLYFSEPWLDPHPFFCIRPATRPPHPLRGRVINEMSGTDIIGAALLIF